MGRQIVGSAISKDSGKNQLPLSYFPSTQTPAPTSIERAPSVS